MVKEITMKQTEIGLIPKDWLLKNIGSIAKVSGRVGWKGYTKKDLVLLGPYAIGAKHINKNNKLDLSDPTCLSNEKYIESPEIFVFKDDLLIVQRGTIGKLVLIEENIGEATINPSMLIIRTKKDSSKFLYYYLLSKEGQNQISKDVSSTGVPMITQFQVNGFQIPLPPLPEQESIAEALSDADAWIDSLEQLIAKKRLIKQGAMQGLLTPKKDWEVKKLGKVCEIIMGQSPLSKFYNDSGKGLPLVQGNADIENRRTIIRNYTSQVTKTGKIGDIIMSVRAPVGEIATATFDCCLGRGVCAFRTENKFIYHLLIYKETDWAQFSTGSTFDSVNSYQIKELEIHLPKSPNEQTRIATILSDMDAELEALEAQLAKARQIKQGMMQELLTGKTRLI